jgi:formylglycine-generating enzyme required for sulfatase activity
MKETLFALSLLIFTSCSIQRQYSIERTENGNEQPFVYIKTISAVSDPFKPVIESRVGGNLDSVKVAYFGGQTEVTNKQYWRYLSYLEETDSLLYEVRKPKTENWRLHADRITFADSLADNYDNLDQFHNYPVVNITPDDAQGFTNWLNNIDTDSLVFYRLFNEFEWLELFNDHPESDSSFAWGANYWRNEHYIPLGNYAEFDQNQVRYNHISDDMSFDYSDSIGYFAYVNGPMSVWSFNPNTWGAYNLSGNVAELTLEHYKLNSTWYCKTHGGSWHSPIFYLRKSPSETYQLPSPFVGFRVLKIEIIKPE